MTKKSRQVAINEWKKWVVEHEFTNECSLDDDALINFVVDIFKSSKVCGGDVEMDYTDISMDMLTLISERAEELGSNIEEESNDVEEYEEENAKMERANRVAVQVVEEGYVARFYRTHKYLGEVTIKTENGEHNNTLREDARVQAIMQCPMIGIEWNPEMQEQAWERKYNTYMTDEQVGEDALTLVTPTIERLVEKCKYDMELTGIKVSAVTPNPSNLSYVEDGRYTKSGAWCCANIEVTVSAHVIGEDMDILYQMELKSGQICKPKTTIAEWNMKVLEEMMLNGIEIPTEEKDMA